MGGAQEVVRRISEGLVRRGHEVTVATTKLAERTETVLNGVRIIEFDISGNAVRGLKGEVDRYQRFLLDGDFDLAMNYAAQQWATDVALPLLGNLPYPAILAPCGFSGLHNPMYTRYFQQMPQALGGYSHLVFHASAYQDIEFARRHGMDHYTIIPNGASREEFLQTKTSFRETHGIPSDDLLLLSVGSHTGEKGHRAAIEAFRRADISPAVLVIVGNLVVGQGCLPDCRRRARWVNWTSFGRKRVLLLDIPRDEVVAAYQAADLFVFPSNVECSPIVLYEAMASRTPFVTTACGNAEEIVQWGGGGIVVPTDRVGDGRVECKIPELAQRIETLARRDGERLRLGEAGHAAWLESFTWEGIVERYERLYRQVLHGTDMAQAAATAEL